MNRHVTHYALAALALLAWCTTTAVAQHDHKHDHNHDHKHHDHDHGHHDHEHGKHDHAHGGMPEMTPEMQKEMMARIKHATPGQHHKHLRFFEGKWDYVAKMYGEGDMPPMEITGTVDAKLDMGGRFLVSRWHGPNPFGPEDFHGMEVLGYDNAKQRFVSTWIDNMSTTTSQASGTCDDSGKVFTHTGKMFDAAKGTHTPTRTVIKVINDNKYSFKMYEKRAGADEKLQMDFTVTRVAGG